MRKYDAPHTDTLDAFNAEIVSLGLDQVLSISLIIDDKLKPEIYKVAKCSPSEKYKTGDDVNIYLNEEIFDQLPDNLQKLAIVEALAGISYDYDKETAVLSKPDFFAYSGVINKYSYEEVVVLKESIRTLYQAGKEQEDATKAITK